MLILGFREMHISSLYDVILRFFLYVIDPIVHVYSTVILPLDSSSCDIWNNILEKLEDGWKTVIRILQASGHALKRELHVHVYSIQYHT